MSHPSNPNPHAPGAADAGTEPPVSELSFEQALERLQLAVKRLESGELALEDALKHFERGVELTRRCQEQLQVAEQRVEILTKGGELKRFEGEGGGSAR